MKFIETNGLKDTKLKPKQTIPIYLTDDYQVLEAPTYWAIKLTQCRSRSIPTLKNYTTIIARYLQWRDDEGYKAESWQNTDEDLMDEYIGYLIEKRDEKGKPIDSTIEYYMARLQNFYTWASNNGYRNYWKMDINKVVRTIKDRSMVNKQIEMDARIFHIQTSVPTHVEQEKDKFVHRENIAKILELFDDEVYAFIFVVIWTTGLRPKDLFQLPYKGMGLNAGLKRYHEEELENLSSILFEFESKGKRRSIKFPGDIWTAICRAWMPKRKERAMKYREKYGVMPPNTALFLSKNGVIVTRKMLSDNFKRVSEKNEYPEEGLTPKMLRHAFATYFVLDALKQYDLLGKPYIYNMVIDDSLREWMGHSNVDTTYKYYVHLINRYFHNDLLEDLNKNKNKEILKIMEKL